MLPVGNCVVAPHIMLILLPLVAKKDGSSFHGAERGLFIRVQCCELLMAPLAATQEAGSELVYTSLQVSHSRSPGLSRLCASRARSSAAEAP